MDLQEFLLNLIIIYSAARVMGEIALRLGQPSVLGELLAGVLIGGSLFGWIEETPTLKLMGEVGVMLLLFEIGLESDLHAFLKVGRAATLVAVVGVAVPFLLGDLLGLTLGLSQLQAIFLGATLTATSIAISARALAELGQLKTPDGHVILGAAVIDDLLGLIILSVLIGLATTGAVSWLEVGRSAGLATLMLATAILIGIFYGHRLGDFLKLLNTRGSLIVASVTFALLLGYLSGLLHIAPLVGAFAAGLVLARTEQLAHIEKAIKPVADVFVPIFFVLVGAAVNLSLLNPFEAANRPYLLLAAALGVAAVLGKLVAGLGALGSKADPLAVGIGMLPRGEVGLIFAGVGLSQGIIKEGEYSAILLVVAGTTFLSPILLKWRYARLRA
ncbi:MAG: cation:proton antiporter [Gammaproteobacteria bacterium]|nr:MAG: cation:proton antiporter [Gammaproteobacteria bacterium]